jgi:hypothetical protein
MGEHAQSDGNRFENEINGIIKPRAALFQGELLRVVHFIGSLRSYLQTNVVRMRCRLVSRSQQHFTRVRSGVK